MLPAHRVIGHKEYGNVGHPGRKQDPIYDMNWRRDRVANFKPRTGDDDMPLTEDDLDRIMRRVWRGATMTDPATGQKILFSDAFAAMYVQNRQGAADAAAARTEMAGLTTAVRVLAENVDGVDGDAILAGIRAEADRIRDEVRQTLAEGYELDADVQFQPRSGE